MTFLNKMNRGLGCGFLFGVFCLAGCEAKSSQSPRKAEVSNISGLEIGMPEAEVLILMGQPHKIKSITREGDDSEFIYDGLTVSLSAIGPSLESPKVVSNIFSSHENYCFNAVICPGDTLASIKAKLGQTETSPAKKDKSARLYYPLLDLETCWLWVFTEDSKISSGVSIACQP